MQRTQTLTLDQVGVDGVECVITRQ